MSKGIQFLRVKYTPMYSLVAVRLSRGLRAYISVCLSSSKNISAIPSKVCSSRLYDCRFNGGIGAKVTKEKARKFVDTLSSRDMRSTRCIDYSIKCFYRLD